MERKPLYKRNQKVRLLASPKTMEGVLGYINKIDEPTETRDYYYYHINLCEPYESSKGYFLEQCGRSEREIELAFTPGPWTMRIDRYDSYCGDSYSTYLVNADGEIVVCLENCTDEDELFIFQAVKEKFERMEAEKKKEIILQSVKEKFERMEAEKKKEIE